jgi:hypothetical protein
MALRDLRQVRPWPGETKRRRGFRSHGRSVRAAADEYAVLASPSHQPVLAEQLALSPMSATAAPAIPHLRSQEISLTYGPAARTLTSDTPQTERHGPRHCRPRRYSCPSIR